MASYTMELREIVEQPSQYQTGLSTREKIEVGRSKLFDFEYPIFDPAYKNVFETHFIRNFYMREIGFETEGLFKFQLESWLLINMPFFNKMFESELIDFDPLDNSRVDTTYTKVTDKNKDDIRDIVQNTTTNEIGSGTQHQDTVSDSINHADGVQHSIIDGVSHATNVQDSTSDEVGNKVTASTQTDDNFNRELKSNTPDTRLNITTNDGEGVITYASTIEEENENNIRTNRTDDDVTKGVISNDTTTNDGTSKSTANGTTTDDQTLNTIGSMDATNSSVNDVVGNSTQNDILNSVINETEDYIQHRVGKVGIDSYSKMLMEYRNSFLRIERQMFDEMQELFMLVY